MSPSRRTAALFGLLALLLLPAVWPYAFAYGDLPRTNDLATHIYRAFELEQLLDTGVFFPRWGPHLVHGYGYPIFHYFGYLSHYLIALLHKAGANYLWAYRLASSGVTLLAGWGAFLLGREMARGERGGLLAGVAFVYSPYMLYTANVRGGLPESLALALLPFVLLTWRRAARDGWRYVVPGGLAYGALVFSHNGIALQSSPLILAFALWSGRARWRGAFARIAACLALGLGLAAFYWIPALVELRFVQVESRFATTGISYAVNFAALRDLFAYPALPVDSDLLNPPVLRPLSVAALALAGTALLIGWRARDALQRDRGLLAVLAAAGIFIALPASRFIWEVVPLLQRSLWPWRYLGPASLFIALLAGTLGSAHVPPHRVAGAARPVLLPLFVVALFIANSAGWLYPPREQIAPPESVADLARYELPPLLIGTSTNAEYLPRWVTELPDTTAQRELLLSEDDPDRLDRASLPPGAGSVHTGSNLFWDQWLVDLPEESVLQFRQFYFPGWRLLIDGEPVPARITAPHGLIAIEAPAGEHSIQLRFESTPIRRFADLASLVSALLVAAYFIARVTKHVSRRGKLRSTFSQIPIPGFTNLRYLSLTALLLCSLFIATWFIDSPLRTHGLAPGNGPTGMEHALAADLGGELRLLGYTLSSDALPADGETELDLYWQAQRELGLSYGFNLRLLDSEGRVWNSSEIVRPADWRFIPGTDFWPPDQYVRDSYVLRPLAGTPPGEYQLHVVAFRADTLVELDTVAVAALRIVAPDRTAYVSASALHTFADDQLELLEVRIDRSAARPGDPVRADLVWRAGPAFATAADLQLALQ
ncbi:MAG: 6-pyruvoyl-tetrahydropterin synthase-related protein, partial [Anaerolineales bacterium]